MTFSRSGRECARSITGKGELRGADCAAAATLGVVCTALEAAATLGVVCTVLEAAAAGVTMTGGGGGADSLAGAAGAINSVS